MVARSDDAQGCRVGHPQSLPRHGLLLRQEPWRARGRDGRAACIRAALLRSASRGEAQARHGAQTETYHAAIMQLGRHLMACLALSLDLPEDYFAPGLEDLMCSVRLLHYPS